jgi:CBS domain-containing protein
MDISTLVSDSFTTFDADTPLSNVAGAFEDQSLDAVVVVDDGDGDGDGRGTFRGLFSRR